MCIYVNIAICIQYTYDIDIYILYIDTAPHLLRISSIFMIEIG